MKTFSKGKVGVLFTVFVAQVLLLVDSTNGAGDEYLEHFRGFANDLISKTKDTTEATETKPGLHLFNPFGIGILLAHINEQVWNVSTVGIPEALHTQKKLIAKEYTQLLRQFRRRQFRISNTVYSRFANLTRPMAFDQFLTHIINLDFTNQTAEFFDSFNSFIDSGTKGYLNNEIVPKLLWRKIFENTTMGSYLNTLYYKGSWEQPWSNIGDKPFNYDSLVPFLETRGEFKVVETANISAVVLNIQDPGKEVIFFKSASFLDTPRLHEEFLKVQANQSLWSMQNLTVQVPAINATNMARHHLGLAHMGVNQTFCLINITDPQEFYYTQQPITQGNHFEISATHLELASASGTLVNYQSDDVNINDLEFAEDYYDDDYDVLETEPELDDIEEHVNSRQFKNQERQRIRRATPSKLLGGCGRPSETGASKLSTTQNQIRTITKQGKSSKMLVFDTPFSWIFRDEEIGEVFYGHVSSLCQFNKASNAIFTSPTHAWLHDVFKVAFWKCIA
ncbi:unnamed protein product [Orchesella dallaii]|uniref:Serpin domain-containing protein n=1 Tax=Orchesella dallaii TaxID=48710 RepID=A0ABP1QQA5_9HEXA